MCGHLNGFVQVYTGKGKGKTTAAIGIGIRAAGAGLEVCMIQFVKGKKDSAIRILEDIENFHFKQFGKRGIRKKENLTEEEKKLAEKALKEVKEAIDEDKIDLLILDEVNIAIDQELIDLDEILEIIEEKPDDLELILTGRYAKEEIIKKSDLVTDMKNIKHYLQAGVKAREGIDY